MRQIFSVRFFAAAAAVAGLFFILVTVFEAGDAIDGDDASEIVVVHRVDLVEQVFSASNSGFRIGEDGLTDNATDLVIDGSRSLRIVADTPGENQCPDFGEVGACAVVADLLGEAVVWFALVPMGRNRTVDFPAIDTLEDGWANLVNDWQLKYAPVLDRRCDDVEFASYRELREEMGDNFVSIFGIEDRQLIAVECDARVDYAPTSASTSLPDSDDLSS